MYAIYGNIYHQYTPNVSIYTIHGSYGVHSWGKKRHLPVRFSSLGSTLQQFLFALGLWASHGASHAVVTATGAMPWPSVHIGSLSQLLLK